MDAALAFPGGGCWAVAPGQVTDDGELTLSLLRALEPGKAYDADRVAASYAHWYLSRPFDIGITTRTALSVWKPGFDDDTEGARDAVAAAAAAGSAGSKANGSLMRATPLGVWGAFATTETIVAAARADSALTHPNPSCSDAVAAYSLAIAELVRSGGDRSAALKRVERWAEEEACDEVRSWLEEAARGVIVPYHPLAGFVRIAFTHSFRHLYVGSCFPDALRETLLGGGDTDTNACIVAGLVGAADGVLSIPEAMRNAVLGCDTSLGQPRPDFLHPRQAPDLVSALLRAQGA